MARIAVLGSANLDLVVRLPRPPHNGETIFGTGFSTVPGGKGLNQAIAAAHAGAEVSFLGAVGKDRFGAMLRDALVVHGIDVTRLIEVAEPTGIADVHVMDGGENAIVVVPGANHAAIPLTEEDRAVIASSDALLTQFERPIPLIFEALQFARAAGVRTVLTPGPVVQVGHELLSLVDLMVPNAGEARILSGLTDDVDAARAISRHAGTVVMTRGAQGQLVARGGEVVEEHVAYRTQAVDTTAAGDTFVGVLAARSAIGDGFPSALRAATVAAGISVSRHGASTSMPHWDEIESALGSW